MIYVRTMDGVGILVRTNTAEEKAYRVKDKHTGNFESYAEVERITDDQYAQHQPVATTKPKRGAKKP